jgi:ABC-type Fe3+/spermidine/putrescine transport system ATPase subunit
VALLELKNLTKIYEHPAVEDIHLSLDRGRILCLLGPSGSGKTTLLRLVAGLEQPDRGQIIFDGKDMEGVAPHRRQFGLMFQEFALFPHKTVFENIAFGPQVQKKKPDEVRRLTQEMLNLVGLADKAQRNVADLSGGERQRVALARSLAPQPGLLMLDEPLGALDRALRERLMLEIRTILKTLSMTAIFVTHDQSEALAVADQIAVMNRGRLEQVDSPETLYLHPRSIFVARFLGFKNLLPGKITSDGAVLTDVGLFHPQSVPTTPQKTITLALRPECARVADSNSSSESAPLVSGRVASRLFTGQSYRISVDVGGDVELAFDLPNENPPPAVGRPVELNLKSSGMVVITATE